MNITESLGLDILKFFDPDPGSRIFLALDPGWENLDPGWKNLDPGSWFNIPIHNTEIEYLAHHICLSI
jgi:hypothetical protein